MIQVGSGAMPWLVSSLATSLLAATFACQQAPNGNEKSAAIEAARLGDMQYLDARNPAATAEVKTGLAAGAARFVIVEVGSVANPRKLPLSFTVAFRPADGPQITLGIFSLYPADNPGRFIVATQGRVKAPGEIIVTLDRAGVDGASDVRVGVRSIQLGQQ